MPLHRAVNLNYSAKELLIAQLFYQDGEAMLLKLPLGFRPFTLVISFIFTLLAACGGEPEETESEVDASENIPVDPCPDGFAEPLEFSSPAACADPGEGEMYFRLTRLSLPGSGPLIGFDLDDHHTVDPGDPIGCGIADELAECRPGVDNKLPAILRILRTASSSFGQLQPIIDEALADGRIDLRVAVKGYDGVGDDEALITLYLNGEIVEGVEDHCVGVNSDGTIAARLDRLPITLPPIPVSDEDVTLVLDLSRIKLLVAPPDEEGVSQALLGGAALWDDGEGRGLRGTAEELVERLLPSVLPTLPSIIKGLLDMGEPGNCDSISVGIEAAFSVIEEL